MRRMWCGVIVVAGLMLSGCVDPGELLAEKVAEKAVEHAIEQGSSDGTKVDIDADGDGGMTIEGEDGTYQMGSHAQVPDDFPSELPLPDASLVSSAAIDGSWLLSFQGATRADFDQLSKYFESGDYERVSTIEMEGMVSHAYNGSEWTVNIGMLGDEDDEPTLNYVVGTVTD